ncbi:hypothetical protein VDGD_08341 [Verticillium dahliae]|nr:hypothetical protein VDGD_08341 [Verticillium dahliae]
MATIRRLAAFILFLVSSVDVRAKNIDYAALPDETLFPGPWERYIKAPADKTRITPARILTTFGNVTTSSATPRAVTPGDHVPGQGILIGPEGLLTLEFDENTGGRYVWRRRGSSSRGFDTSSLTGGTGFASTSSLWATIQSFTSPTLNLLCSQGSCPTRRRTVRMETCPCRSSLGPRLEWSASERTLCEAASNT